MLSRERPSMPRRSLLAGLAALPAATISAQARVSGIDPGPDAELIALGRALEAAWAVENRVCIEIRDDDSDTGQAKLDEAFGRCADLVHAIEALNATTAAGLRVKLRALEWCRNGDPLDVVELFGPTRGEASTDLRLVVAILADIRRTA